MEEVLLVTLFVLVWILCFVEVLRTLGLSLGSGGVLISYVTGSFQLAIATKKTVNFDKVNEVILYCALRCECFI